MRDYRNCIQHYESLGRIIPSVNMTRLDNDGPWLAQVLLPDNPEAVSQIQFAYESNIDALSFGLDVTIELLIVAREIAKSISDPSRED